MAAETVNSWRPALLGLLMAACASAAAQTATSGPETRQMIEALKPPATRGMRNLVVRPSAPEATAAAPAGAEAVPAQTSTGALVPAPAPSSPPDAAPAPAPAAEPDTTAQAPPSLTLPIRFDSNSARVRPESGPLLGNLVAAMMSPDLKASRFVIEGHTDASGAAAANLLLSQQRADEVRLYLVALGVHPARLKTLGKGSTAPANPNEPLSAENRRVRVVTLE